MFRRRRPRREIPFGLDSFLDIVANVVGIIIRLILVAWVGARSYTSLTVRPPPAAAPRPDAYEKQEFSDPLQDELARLRRELAAAQERLLAQLRDLEQLKSRRDPLEQERAYLLASQARLQSTQAQLDRQARDGDVARQEAVLSLEEIRQRRERLLAEIRAQEQLPPVRQSLRYRTPVSRPVQAEEIMFECRAGRVTLIDIATLLGEVRHNLEDNARGLQTRFEVTEYTAPVGAFRLRYTLERERDLVEGLGGTRPSSARGFRYGLSEWVVDPVAPARGETAAQALAGQSEFRQVADSLDPNQCVVTFWVYPDSFALYRQLRDYLYDRQVVVAGRPLPAFAPIASSRRGTVSRGQ